MPLQEVVLLTINGITVGLQPAALPWSRKPTKEAIVNIAGDMKHIDATDGSRCLLRVSSRLSPPKLQTLQPRREVVWRMKDVGLADPLLDQKSLLLEVK